jgi:hypothetical protein
MVQGFSMFPTFPVTFQADDSTTVAAKRSRTADRRTSSEGAGSSGQGGHQDSSTVAPRPPPISGSAGHPSAVATPAQHQVQLQQQAVNAVNAPAPTDFFARMASVLCDGVASGQVNQTSMAGILNALASGSLANLTHQPSAASTSGSNVAAGSGQQSASTGAAPAATDGAGGRGGGRGNPKSKGRGRRK